MMEEGAANELENRIRLLIAPMNFWEQVGFLFFLLGVATHDGITTQEAETRRTAFRSALTFGLPAGRRPNVEDVDIDFIVTAALSDKEEFRQIIQRLQSAVIHESDILADRQGNAQNAQDGSAGIPHNIGQQNLQVLQANPSMNSDSTLTTDGSRSEPAVGLHLSADTSAGTADASAGGTNPQNDPQND
mmetsp:Transcript_27886/g.50507  ORF Transcript_27886/g.50507 Transcript_27886/m.50507 type:complete len:189 (-) Transcript_27886:72-638(-)